MPFAVILLANTFACAQMHVCELVHTCVHPHACVHACLCTVCLYAHAHVCVCVCSGVVLWLVDSRVSSIYHDSKQISIM